MFKKWGLLNSVLAILITTKGMCAQRDTSLLRELAKNKPRVLIVTSGADAQELGQSLQAEILKQPEKKKPGEVIVASVQDAASIAAAEFKDGTSYIFIILTKGQKPDIPASLAAVLPIRLGDVKENESIVKCERTIRNDKNLTFAIAMAAPDKKRLEPRLETVKTRRAAKYDSLQFTERFYSYKLAVFSSPADMEAVKNWGQNVPSGVKAEFEWHSLDERDKMQPEQLDELNQVYFINRKEGLQPPTCAAKLLEGLQIRDTTTVVRRSDLGHGCSIAVISAPTDVLLKAKASHYLSFDSITGGQIVEEAKDLRRIGRTTLLVSGGPNNADDKEAIRLQLAFAMRKLNMPVEERGDILKLLDREVTLQQLQGASDTDKLLRRKLSLRYVWLYTIVEYSGGTEFNSGMQLIHEDQAKSYEQSARGMLDPEPQLIIKSVGGGYKDEYARKKPIFDREHEAWARRKADWEDKANGSLTAQFDRYVTSTTSARTSGILRLIDIADPNKPAEVIWESEVSGTAVKGPDNLRQDTVTVRAGTKPNSMEPPSNNSMCPADLLKQAAVRAGTSGIDKLAAGVLPPDGSEPLVDPPIVLPPMPPIVIPPQRPMPPARPVELLVAGTANGAVILAGGKNFDLRVGDRVYIVLDHTDIKDPTTHEILRAVVTKSITLKVVNVDEKSADCLPVSAAEAAKLSFVKPEMPAKFAHPTPPISPAKKEGNKQ